MQFLKEEIKNKIIPSSKENGELSEYQYSHNVAYGTVLTIIEYLLEKEKEQIIEANRQGRCNDCPIMYTTLEAEDYYKQTYKQTNAIVVDDIKSQVTTTDVWTPKTN